MTYPHMIGLCGAMGAGKDSVADYLVERYGYTRLSWADPLKEVAWQVYGRLRGVELRHFFGTQEDKDEPLVHVGGRTGREILQHLGTEGFRAIYSNTWVDVGMARVRGLEGVGNRWVVSDVRFPNEVEAIRSVGGEYWEVVRTDRPQYVGEGHISEQAWRVVERDRVLRAATGELPKLYEQVDGLLNVSEA